MRLRFILLFLFVIAIPISAHPWKPKHYVIIDTDGGFDDMRAITLMLASPEIRVLAITASPGVLSAEDTYVKVNSLLTSFYNDGVPTGLNNTNEIKPLNCLPAKEFRWNKKENTFNKSKSAVEIISYILHHSDNRIAFVCLGSLNLPAYCLKNIPEFRSHLSSIIWSNGLSNFDKSFNYSLDKNAWKSICNDSIPVKIINGSSGYNNFEKSFSTLLIPDTATDIHSAALFNSLEIKTTQYATDCFDEKVVLFLHYPTYFNETKEKNVYKYSLNNDITANQTENALYTILMGTGINRSQVLKEIPTDTTLYLPDVQAIFEKTYKKYGKEEWQTAVLANEMHRHLGVVATLGVKMGIRAREYFAAGLDELYIVSHAGLNQPLSCINDGLQLSTGATLGHALITVDTSYKPALPEAVFVYMGRKLKITLKPEIQKQIFSELNDLNYLYGLQSNIYWEMVRHVALKYWSTLDRHEIFILEEIK